MRRWPHPGRGKLPESCDLFISHQYRSERWLPSWRVCLSAELLALTSASFGFTEPRKRPPRPAATETGRLGAHGRDSAGPQSGEGVSGYVGKVLLCDLHRVSFICNTILPSCLCFLLKRFRRRCCVVPLFPKRGLWPPKRFKTKHLSGGREASKGLRSCGGKKPDV